MESPLVSIICLCYNHSKFVVEAIDSVLVQTYANVELIIVDDASDDNSVININECIKGLPEIKFIALEKNVGNCKAFNIGWRMSSGQFIIDLAADDLLMPERVSVGVESLLKVGKDYGVNFTNAELIDKEGKIIGKHLTSDFTPGEVPEGFLFKQLLKKYFINPVTMMYSKQLLEYLDGYDEDLAYEDFDLWVRSSQEFKYCFSDAVLVRKRILRMSHSRSQYRPGSKILHSTLKVCEKAFKICLSKMDFEALKIRLNYEIKMAVSSINWGIAVKMMKLRARVKLAIINAQ